jgi:hypothetical protein
MIAEFPNSGGGDKKDCSVMMEKKKLSTLYVASVKTVKDRVGEKYLAEFQVPGLSFWRTSTAVTGTQSLIS